MADRVYLSLVPKRDAPRLDQDRAEKVGSFAGAEMLEFEADDRPVLFGFSNASHDPNSARSGLERALSMEFGEEWQTSFDVVDS